MERSPRANLFNVKPILEDGNPRGMKIWRDRQINFVWFTTEPMPKNLETLY
jgi:hypothetical protein